MASSSQEPTSPRSSSSNLLVDGAVECRRYDDMAWLTRNEEVTRLIASLIGSNIGQEGKSTGGLNGESIEAVDEPRKRRRRRRRRKKSQKAEDSESLEEEEENAASSSCTEHLDQQEFDEMCVTFTDALKLGSASDKDSGSVTSNGVLKSILPVIRDEDIVTIISRTGNFFGDAGSPKKPEINEEIPSMSTKVKKVKEGSKASSKKGSKLPVFCTCPYDLGGDVPPVVEEIKIGEDGLPVVEVAAASVLKEKCKLHSLPEKSSRKNVKKEKPSKEKLVECKVGVEEGNDEVKKVKEGLKASSKKGSKLPVLCTCPYDLGRDDVPRVVEKIKIGEDGLPVVEVAAASVLKNKCKLHSIPEKSSRKNVKKEKPLKETLYDCKAGAEEGNDEVKKRRRSRGKKKSQTENEAEVTEGDQKDGAEKSKKESEKEKKDFSFSDYISEAEVAAGIEDGTLVQGSLRINPRNYKEAYINSPTKGLDISVSGIKDRNRALEGDEITIRLKPEGKWKTTSDGQIQKTAEVVFIQFRHHPMTGAGTLEPITSLIKRYALFVPRDSRLPRMRIPVQQCPPGFLKRPDAFSNILFCAEIRDWKDTRYAMANLTKCLGFQGDLNAETEAILLENGLCTEPFNAVCLSFLPMMPYKISPAEIDKREDLRRECIFTIDPLTARDLDDAMSCKVLDNGNLEVGVHISDVTFFLEEGTHLDSVVSMKATSVYLVQKVYHMLPEELCMLCSLLPGEDKLAVSVFWEMTPEAEIVRHRITRSVINSCSQLAYEHAQAVIDNPTKEWTAEDFPTIHGDFTPEKIAETVLLLQSIAKILRKKRFDGGALRIDQPKLVFFLDKETELPQDFTIAENKDSHRMIEEFMLLANVTVAQKIYDAFPKIAFLRNHPAPHGHLLAELQKTMELRGIHLDIETSGGMQKSLWRYTMDDFAGQARMLVLNNLCARPMARAKYFCAKTVKNLKEFWHYALSIPIYTHFTSPIRRYADVMVHRVLMAALGYTEEPKWDLDKVARIASNCNGKKFSSKKAGEQSTELYLNLYLASRCPLVEKAVVMDVKDHSFDVILCRMGSTQRVYTNQLPVKVKYSVENKVATMELLWEATDKKPEEHQVVEVFSLVTVVLLKSKVPMKIDTVLLRPSEVPGR